MGRSVSYISPLAIVTKHHSFNLQADRGVPSSTKSIGAHYMYPVSHHHSVSERYLIMGHWKTGLVIYPNRGLHEHERRHRGAEPPMQYYPTVANKSNRYVYLRRHRGPDPSTQYYPTFANQSNRYVYLRRYRRLHGIGSHIRRYTV